jgi:hypothetical protein
MSEGEAEDAVAASLQLPFTHVRAWVVIGGIGMPQGRSRVSLATTSRGEYSLESDIDEAMRLRDRGHAIGNAMLAALVGQGRGGSKEEMLAASLETLLSERKRQTGSMPILLFVGGGQIEVKLGEPRHEEDDYVITFDTFDKNAIANRFNHSHRSIQLALALESSVRVRFQEVAVGTYCTLPNGKTLYSINFHGSGEGTVSTSLADAALPSIARRFAMLDGQPELASSVRLFADMAAYGREPFRAFVSGWAALEILVKKTFREYEDEFYGGLTSPHQPALAAQFIRRARESLGRGLNVRDQFLAMSAVLLPRQSTAEAQGDLDAFLAIKKQRDDIAHGADFDEAALPIQEVNRLLTKYLAAHADRSHERARAEVAAAGGLAAATAPVQEIIEDRRVL